VSENLGDLLWLDYEAQYEEISSTAVSANPAVAVPLLTINGWILMERRVPGGSVTFNQNWAEYRDGFGSAAGNDNYWLGLDKVYRLIQMTGNATLRVEVCQSIIILTVCHVPFRGVTILVFHRVKHFATVY